MKKFIILWVAFSCGAGLHAIDNFAPSQDFFAGISSDNGNFFQGERGTVTGLDSFLGPAWIYGFDAGYEHSLDLHQSLRIQEQFETESIPLTYGIDQTENIFGSVLGWRYYFPSRRWKKLQGPFVGVLAEIDDFIASVNTAPGSQDKAILAGGGFETGYQHMIGQHLVLNADARVCFLSADGDTSFFSDMGLSSLMEEGVCINFGWIP